MIPILDSVVWLLWDSLLYTNPGSKLTYFTCLCTVQPNGLVHMCDPTQKNGILFPNLKLGATAQAGITEWQMVWMRETLHFHGEKMKILWTFCLICPVMQSHLPYHTSIEGVGDWGSSPPPSQDARLLCCQEWSLNLWWIELNPCGVIDSLNFLTQERY
jgi:hypothetical protein